MMSGSNLTNDPSSGSDSPPQKARRPISSMSSHVIMSSDERQDIKKFLGYKEARKLDVDDIKYLGDLLKLIGQRVRDTDEVKALLKLIGQTGLDTNDIETLKRLIDHKVKHVDEPTQATFHLNTTVERDEDKERLSLARTFLVNAVKTLDFSDEHGEKSFIDVFFPERCNIREKLDSLMSHEWKEDERNNFHRIFLTAATREKRHDIVDVILHRMGDMDNEKLRRDSSA